MPSPCSHPRQVSKMKRYGWMTYRAGQGWRGCSGQRALPVGVRKLGQRQPALEFLQTLLGAIFFCQREPGEIRRHRVVFAYRCPTAEALESECECSSSALLSRTSPAARSHEERSRHASSNPASYLDGLDVVIGGTRDRLKVVVAVVEQDVDNIVQALRSKPSPKVSHPRRAIVQRFTFWPIHDVTSNTACWYFSLDIDPLFQAQANAKLSGPKTSTAN